MAQVIGQALAMLLVLFILRLIYKFSLNITNKLDRGSSGKSAFVKGFFVRIAVREGAYVNRPLGWHVYLCEVLFIALSFLNFCHSRPSTTPAKFRALVLIKFYLCGCS